MVIQDGPPGQATSWDHQEFEVDQAGNIYILNRLCQYYFLRQIRPDGSIKTLLRYKNISLDRNVPNVPEILPENALFFAQFPSGKPEGCMAPQNYIVDAQRYLNIVVDPTRQIVYLDTESDLYAYDVKTAQLRDVDPLNVKKGISAISVSPEGYLYQWGAPQKREGEIYNFLEWLELGAE